MAYSVGGGTRKARRTRFLKGLPTSLRKSGLYPTASAMDFKAALSPWRARLREKKGEFGWTAGPKLRARSLKLVPVNLNGCDREGYLETQKA